MPKLIQYCLFDPPEVTELPVMDAAVGDYKQNMFVQKFRPKTTTDDYYTPPAVYDAVKNWVNENLLDLRGWLILRPFRLGGDYLHENYPDGSVVIDNPPFSIYSQIVRDYTRMGVKFFLFGPALSLFVRDVDEVQYVICRCNITYANGAKVRTGFVHNLGGPRLCMAGDLSDDINKAQYNKAAYQKFIKPSGIYSAADLMRFVPKECEKIYLTGGAEIYTHIDGRKIFGGAMKFDETETNKLKQLDDERA
jgi:hypothetical protein